MKRTTVLFILTAVLLFQWKTVQAQSAPSCSFQLDGSIICTTGGGNDGGGDNGDGGNDNSSDNVCTPGSHLAFRVLEYDASTSTCRAYPIRVDNCTGEVINITEQIGNIPCELPNPSPPQHPCTNFSVSAGGITCENTGLNLSARVPFPEIYLDVRPYPATLVRWPTAVRNGGLPESSGSGGVNYIANGGGSPNNPQEGDWQDLRLILTLRPAGPMFATLPHIGDLMLPNQGATGSPTMIQWEVPSH